MTAVVLLHRTFMTGPMRGVETLGVVELDVGVLVLLPPLLESFMPFCDFCEDMIVGGGGELICEAKDGAGEGGGGPIVAKGLC